MFMLNPESGEERAAAAEQRLAELERAIRKLLCDCCRDSQPLELATDGRHWHPRRPGQGEPCKAGPFLIAIEARLILVPPAAGE